MLSEEELNKLVELDLCMELLEEYNSFNDIKLNFDLIVSRECLSKMTLEELKVKSEEIQRLKIKHETVKFLDKVLKEIELYGVEYTKEKYLKESKNDRSRIN